MTWNDSYVCIDQITFHFLYTENLITLKYQQVFTTYIDQTQVQASLYEYFKTSTSKFIRVFKKKYKQDYTNISKHLQASFYKYFKTSTSMFIRIFQNKYKQVYKNISKQSQIYK